MKNTGELILRYISDSNFRWNANDKLGFYKKLDDEQYLKRKFKACLGYDLNIENPRTFNEKLQWLKLYDRNPEYTKMVDKYFVKEYVSSIIGQEYVIPTLGVWNNYDEIDFDNLPDQFVLKCTHDSGGLVVCKNKNLLDYDQIRKKITKSLKRNYYNLGREWPYKNVKPRIIAEKYIDGGKEGLIDYKFYCFNGVPKLLYVSQGLDNHSTAKISYLNLDWTFSDIQRTDYDSFSELPKKPKHFDEMLLISNRLANGIPYLRVDLYEVSGKVYFGELTFYPGAGFTAFKNYDDDLKLGQLLSLPIDYD